MGAALSFCGSRRRSRTSFRVDYVTESEDNHEAEVSSQQQHLAPQALALAPVGPTAPQLTECENTQIEEQNTEPTVRVRRWQASLAITDRANENENESGNPGSSNDPPQESEEEVPALTRPQKNWARVVRKLIHIRFLRRLFQQLQVHLLRFSNIRRKQ